MGLFIVVLQPIFDAGDAGMKRERFEAAVVGVQSQHLPCESEMAILNFAGSAFFELCMVIQRRK